MSRYNPNPRRMPEWARKRAHDDEADYNSDYYNGAAEAAYERTLNKDKADAPSEDENTMRSMQVLSGETEGRKVDRKPPAELHLCRGEAMPEATAELITTAPVRIAPQEEREAVAVITSFEPELRQMKMWPALVPYQEKVERILQGVREARTAAMAFLKLPERIEQAYQLHRGLTADRARICKPFDDVEELCKARIAQMVLEMRQEAEAERRRLQAEADAKAEQARLAEVEALKAQAAQLEKAEPEQAQVVFAAAEQKATEPLIPTIVSAPAVAKTKGSSTVMKKVAARIDVIPLLTHILGIPLGTNINPNFALLPLIEIKEGEVNRLLNKGIELPGVTVAQKAEVRSRG